jgi:hypothetical protein
MRGTLGLLRTLPTETLPAGARTQLLEIYGRLHGTPGGPG